MKPLHEINNQLLQVMEGYTTDADGVDLPDIHSIDMEAKEKVKNVLRYCNRLEAEINLVEETSLKRLQTWLKKYKTIKARLEGEAMLTMEISGLTEIDEPDFRVIIPKSSTKPLVQDEKLIPDEYNRTIPAQIKPDMALIKKALKAGEKIAGVIEVPTSVSLKYDKPKKAA